MQTLAILFSAVLLSCCGPSLGYPQGAPPSACVDMFPSGHDAKVQSSTPPYELLVSSTNLTANTQYTVTLRLKAGVNTHHFMGMFVQARHADNCSFTSPIGNFSIPTDEQFMIQMSCNATNDALTQNNIDMSMEISKSFTWTSPSTIPGTIYFRATVVYEMGIFWTNVFSTFLLPSGAKPNPQFCSLQNVLETTTMSSTTTATTVTSTKVSSTVGTSDASTVSLARMLTAAVGVAALVARI